jgi:SAM-dependent methyltransferase
MTCALLRCLLSSFPYGPRYLALLRGPLSFFAVDTQSRWGDDAAWYGSRFLAKHRLRGIVVSMHSGVPPGEPQTCATSYDQFAFAYNLYWGSLSLNWLRWLSVMLAPRLPPNARVLDLCCGTGNLAAELSRRGLWMTGLDASRPMLRYAQANAPDVPLVQADIRSFGMRSCFDAAICLFDSLNHLLSVEDLDAAFASVFRCVRPGGWFLFDVNTAHGYTLHWSGSREMVGTEHTVRTWSSYDETSSLGQFQANITRLGPAGWIQSEATLWQRCHDNEKLVGALSRAGFNLVEMYGLEGETVVSCSTEEVERAFYLCRRPRGPRRSSDGMA